MTKKFRKRSSASPLEKHPKIVRAIGMISIENASMETMLGELLGALLGIHLQIGLTVYFTPKSAIARLDLIENVTDESVGDHPDLLDRVNNVIKRAKTVIGKRHAIIHSLWAENEFANTATWRILFPKSHGEDVSFASLERLINDFRDLIEEIAPLIDDIQAARGVGWRPLRAS